VGVEGCKIVFLGGGHFLFISSDTFAVGCRPIVQPQLHSATDKKTDGRQTDRRLTENDGHENDGPKMTPGRESAR